MQGCLVGGAAANDHGDVEIVNELTQVENVVTVGHVLRRHRRATDDEKVRPGIDHRLGRNARHSFGDSDPATGTPAARISAIRSVDELSLDRLGVNLLHPTGGGDIVRSTRASSSRYGVGSS